MKTAYKQAAKEARWALIVTIMYVFGWCMCAYLPKDATGLFGFPLWFELSCFYLPIVFVVVGYWTIKQIYQEIDLNVEDKQ